ncbi:Syncytin-2 [Nibea albiflora]|nr:Syncytin-2 [Nibea albiflora]
MTIKLNEGIYRPVMTVPSTQMPRNFSLCFTRHNNIVVGTSSNCAQTVIATCGWVWNISQCNISSEPDRVKLENDTIYSPSDDGAISVTDALWLCGDSLWAQLPPHWSGTCALVYLTPTLQLYDKLSYTIHHYPQFRAKREATGMTSEGTKFLGGIVPWWGTVNNAHNIDKLHVQLENLTGIISDGFAALTPWVAATRATLIQHRIALDLLLAAQGGLCHVIGEKCCTYIPDITGNMSMTVNHLNDLLAKMKKDDVTLGTGWNWWDWFSWEGWKGKILALVTPIAAILVLLCVCTTFVIPCIRSSVTKLVAVQIQAALTPYDPLPHEDTYTPGGVDSSTDLDSEAEDSM